MRRWYRSRWGTMSMPKTLIDAAKIQVQKLLHWRQRPQAASRVHVLSQSRGDALVTEEATQHMTST